MANDEIDDGGPAFPIPHFQDSVDGMTLRDWFAGHALAGMSSIAMDDGDMLMGWGDMARASYKAADAMIAARKVSV